MCIKCKGYWTPSTPMSPPEFDCDYENSGGITCDECIINGGDMSPVSGKVFRGNRAPYEKACLKRYGPQFFEDGSDEDFFDFLVKKEETQCE